MVRERARGGGLGRRAPAGIQAGRGIFHSSAAKEAPAHPPHQRDNRLRHQPQPDEQHQPLMSQAGGPRLVQQQQVVRLQGGGEGWMGRRDVSTRHKTCTAASATAVARALGAGGSGGTGAWARWPAPHSLTSATNAPLPRHSRMSVRQDSSMTMKKLRARGKARGHSVDTSRHSAACHRRPPGGGCEHASQPCPASIPGHLKQIFCSVQRRRWWGEVGDGWHERSWQKARSSGVVRWRNAASVLSLHSATASAPSAQRTRQNSRTERGVQG